MSKYVIVKQTENMEGAGNPDLLVNILFKDRISAISYVRMHVEKNHYKITRGEVDFPITGNMIVFTSEEPVIVEEYQLVELISEYSEDHEKVMKEIEDWTMSLLGRKIGS